MSTKTNFKRVALVAVASLGLGVLTSVAPASAAVTLAVGANGATSSDTQGLLTAGGIAIAVTTTTATATMLSNGQLAVVSNEGAATSALVVSGGTIASCSTTTNTVTLSADKTICSSNGADAAGITAIVRPTAVGTNLVIMGKTTNSPLTWATETALTVSVVAATSIGTFSPVYSDVKVQHVADADGTLSGVTAANQDEKYTAAMDAGFHDTVYGAVTTTTRKNGVQGFLNFVLKDANDNALATTNVITATATGGCLVGISTTSQIGVSSSGMLTADGDYISVGQAVANTPYKCVVTLAINGAVIATRTFVLQGQVTKLVVSDQVIAHTGVDTTAAFYVDAQDASGNSVPDVTIGSVTSTYNASVTGVSVPAVSEVTAGTPGTVTCDVKGSNTGLKLYAQNASVALVYSDAFSVSCAGSPVNYAASLDKASYTIGEVATLTITAKDSAGNLTWDGAELGDSTSATTASTYAVSIAGGPMTQVGTIVSTDSFVSGVKKYKFTVGGISSGSFQLVVDLPVYNSTTYSQTAAAVAYKVTTGADGGVQLADVLKAIVSLIASINKQIAALQKALLKK
jgi:hypothetical protein